MGNPVSKAKEDANAQKGELDHLIKVLENKVDAFESKVRLTRGATESQTEVCGGRTIMHLSEIRVASSTSISDELMGAINDFFGAAQGAIAGDKQGAKSAAVKGAQGLLSSGLNALFGVSKGQAMEKQSFVVLFMNNAFVRVDYYVYSYSVSADKWGAQANESGACYVADLAVLDPAKLNPSEIDFLLSQALVAGDGEFDSLMQIKTKYVELSILSRMLANPDLNFEMLSSAVSKMGECQKAMDTVFSSLAPASVK